MAETQFDVIVVGSGASAVHAAWPLAKAGLRVAMIDVAFEDSHYRPLVPDRDFLSLRREDKNQHRYFLGDRFEGVPFGPVRVGAQLTPPRQFITREAETLGNHVSETFSPMQSFALGGLGAGWGASTMPYVDEELADWPISRADLQPHYEAVAARIGVCGANNDDLVPFVGRIKNMLPPAKMDSNARTIFTRYKRLRPHLNACGFFVGAPRLALCTREHHGRGPLQYNDMEFWTDHERAVYRPRYTVEELRHFPGFSFHGGLLVERFNEEEGRSRISVSARDVLSNERVEFRARRLVLAAGAINTARLVLRSLDKHNVSVPFVCNPYTYFPSINVRRLGQATRDRRHSLTQLTMVYDPDGSRAHVLQPQLYSYRSLLLFKLLKESPLAHRESIRLMRLLEEYFVIVGVFHEDRPSTQKRLVLRGDTPDRDCLEIHYDLDRGTEESQRRHERAICGYLRKLGCVPLKAIHPGHGSSIHYGGSFPMTQKGTELTATPEGRLRAAPLVTLADGSTFPHLPAKGLTFTLMANANRVGTLLAREMGTESIA